MNRGRVGEERGGKETDGCLLTAETKKQTSKSSPIKGPTKRIDVYRCLSAMSIQSIKKVNDRRTINRKTINKKMKFELDLMRNVYC
jgi:hypothetical protein